MGRLANSITGGELTRPSDLEQRILRSMIAGVAMAVIVSAMMAPWRVTTGILLGGLLSILNHSWLHASIAALLTAQEAGAKPRLSVWKFCLRYLVVAGAVFAAYQLHLISLPAAIAGLCSFVFALFVEAFREAYFAIIRREESF